MIFCFSSPHSSISWTEAQPRAVTILLQLPQVVRSVFSELLSLSNYTANQRYTCLGASISAAILCHISSKRETSPRAVVVKARHTIVTGITVFGSWGSVHVAGGCKSGTTEKNSQQTSAHAHSAADNRAACKDKSRVA